ncbi:tetratricopeptide repeat protein [Beggiatoa alba]|nr:tetratricopeptide repeat protein [Beggiatoa alba]
MKANKHNPGITLFLTFLISLSFQLKADDDPLSLANMAYYNQNYIQSESLYKKTKGFDGLMGQANSLYRQKNYTKAIHLYTQSVINAHSDQQRALSLYNLANTYYMLGDYSESINLYQDALKYNASLTQAHINLTYAIAINQKVEDALALREGRRQSLRPGAGPRTAKIEDGIDVGNSKVTLSNDETEQTSYYQFPTNNPFIKNLIERGIKYSRISSTTIDNKKSGSEWNYDYTSLDMVELFVKQEKLDNFNLWKRLFEIEEGFPAPVETPHTQAGENPW